jgi:putative nucleotidyltransferase with HDIG domain
VTAAIAPLVSEATAAPAGEPGRPDADARPRGHGQRLLEAMVAFERFPALAYSRDRLLELLEGDETSVRETIAVVESDPALTIAALRLANSGRPPGVRPICGIPAAVAEVTPGALRAQARELPVFHYFGQGGVWSATAPHFRVHAVATLRGAERLIREGLAEQPDQFRVAALLHDIGKLVVLHAYGHYTTGGEAPACKRLLAERRAWGLDHAIVGGVLARRVGLPNRIATLIERHHADEDGGDAALLRLADTLVHYSVGHPVDRAELIAASDRCGVARSLLDALLYELPISRVGARPVEPSPLTPRQTTVLRLLAEGKLYKQIAAELGLTTSTIRSHLHTTYGKLGVLDRAQAVLLASEQGWLA